MMADEPMYDAWIARRRAAEPAHDVTGRVVASVEGRAPPRRYVHFADRINESRPARLAACLAGLLVGSIPFFFVAYVAQSLAF